MILTNLLYPPACLLCHTLLSVVDADRPLCAECEQACPRDAAPGGSSLAPEIPRARWRYTHRAAQAVQQFKYHRRWRLGRWLASGMAETARTTLPLQEIDLIVPVPMHLLKFLLRGSDPATQLAQDLGRSLHRPCLPRALRRTRWTATQTRLHGRARRRNVRNAFKAMPQAVRQRTVLLVDDVLTSGATARACAQALHRAGAARVYVLTAARASSNA